MNYYNKNYYSQLDKIVVRYKRRRMARQAFENAKAVCKYGFGIFAVWGAFYFVWSLTSYVFPGW